MRRTLYAALASLAAFAPAASAATAGGGEYAATLSKVYEAPQYIRALKELCDVKQEQTRPVNDAAYNAWRRRNRALLDELDRRFLVMIRAASTSEQDYTRNVGKYEGAVVQNREELKEQMAAAAPQELERRCREFPQYLRSEDGDLAKRYAEELKAIRKRKM